MSKGEICVKHGKEMVKESAKKILRIVRKCPACWGNFRKGLNKMCDDHNKNFDDWETVKVEYYRSTCEDCGALK